MNAVIVLGHGSRATGVAEQMDQLAAALATRLSDMIVRSAHRELCDPSLEAVVDELVQGGCQRIVVVPYFLHLGNHLQKDIPEQIEALRATYPQVELVLADHLGFDERFIAVLEDRVNAALVKSP